MKKWSLVVILFVCFLLSAYRHEGDDIQQLQAIEQLQDVFVQQRVHLKRWNVYAKEHIHASNPQSWIQQRVNTPSSFSWTVERQKVTGKRITSAYVETIQLIALHAHSQWLLLYEATGSTWDERTKRAIARQTSEMFAHPTFFTCITGVIDGKMKGVLFDQAVQLLIPLAAQPIESLTEEAFVSLSAYTEQWSSSLRVGDRRMNVQVALRTDRLGERTTVVIGTPIITVEY